MYKHIHLKTIFTSSKTIRHNFLFKDKLQTNQRSKVIYKFSCLDCDASYIGKTKRTLAEQKKEHFKALTVQTKFSSIATHTLKTNHSIDWDNIKILDTANNDFHLRLKEAFLIKEEKPLLNEKYTHILAK